VSCFLTYAKEKRLDCEWFDGYEIIGDDGKIVVINRENKVGCDTTIDKSKNVLLSGSERSLVIRPCAVIMSMAVDDDAV
jgi:hypothetical protein